MSISSSSVSRVLRSHGIDPAPARTHSDDWATFLESHAEQITAIDATAVEALVGDRLVTHWCVMAIHHDTRRVKLVDVTEHLTEDWMVQQARNLTDPDHGFLRGRRFLIMDRGPNFSAKFSRSGIRTNAAKIAKTQSIHRAFL